MAFSERGAQALGVVSAACAGCSGALLVAPDWWVRHMLATPKAYKEDGEGNRLLQLAVRWAGLFWLGVAVAEAWLARQMLAVNSGALHGSAAAPLRTLLRLFGAVWVLDAFFIKFLHFGRHPDVINFKDGPQAGVADLCIGLAHFALARSPAAVQ